MGLNSYFHNCNIDRKPVLLIDTEFVRKWVVCGQLACIVYDGNQVFVIVACETIKLWMNINGIFDCCMIPNICLEIRTINMQLCRIGRWRKLLQVEAGRLLVKHLVAEKMLIHDLVKTNNKLLL